jgi:argininosuccinate lyase
VRSVLTVSGSVRARSGHGGTAPDRVAEQLAAVIDVVHRHAAWANPPAEEAR